MSRQALEHLYEKKKDYGNQDLERILQDAQEQKVNYLDISGNAFTEVVIEQDLPHLEILDLSYNTQPMTLKLGKGLPNLKYLWVYDSQLTSIEFEAPLPQLDTLHLRQNKLTSINLPEGFDSLVTLYLQDNQLAHFPEELIGQLSKLEFLSLKGNQLANTDLLGMVDSADDNCLALVKEYVATAKQEGTKKDLETKVLLIGNGNVGKSCFVHRLVHNQFEANWNSTHAISLEEFPSPDSNKELADGFPYRLNLWDFGGQDIYHATHRLFMQADALYLLFWDKETEASDCIEIKEYGEVREYENHPLSYWLAYANALGENSPVIVTRTKAGEDLQEIAAPNQNQLNKQFKDIIKGFRHIESVEDDAEDSGYEDLLKLVKRSIKKQKHDGKVLSNLIELRGKIRELQKEGDKTLKMDTYLEMANDCDLTSDEGHINAHIVLRDWLVKTGVVFYREGLFSNEIILDQAWAIKAIYTLFDRDEVYYDYLQNKKGKFTGENLQKVWKDFNEQEQELFVSFMLQCEMCFEVTPESEEDKYSTVPFAERSYIAPQLLPEEKPKTVERAWRKEESWYIKYSFEFLHYGVVQSFIVRTRKYAEIDDIWKNGILLFIEETDEMGMVESVATKDGKSEIIVRLSADSKKLADKIRNEIEALQDSKPTIMLSDNGADYVPLQELEDNANVEELKAENGKYVKVNELRKFVGVDKNETFEKEKTKKVMENKIFISYSSADRDLREIFANRLNIYLKSTKNQFEEAWTDKEIAMGDDWNEEIQSGLSGSSIGILLVSPMFLGSKYAMGDELKKMLDRRRDDGYIIIPVLLRNCNFKNNEDLNAMQFFKTYQSEYDVTDLLRKDKFMPFEDLADVPNPSGRLLNKYFVKLAEEIDRAVSKRIKNSK